MPLPSDWTPLPDSQSTGSQPVGLPNDWNPVAVTPEPTQGIRESLGRGAIQGLILDPAEAVVQGAEHLPGVGQPIARAVPQSVRGPLQEFRRKAQSTLPGEISEFGFSTVPWLFLGQPETALGRIAAGAVGAAAQPVSGGDFWTQKAIQSALGGVAGGGLGELAARSQMLPHDIHGANTELYRWAVEPIGGTAPTRAHGTSLADIRDQITQPLNAANMQLSLDKTNPQTTLALQDVDTISKRTYKDLLHGPDRSDWNDDVKTFVTEPLEEGALSSQAFANYINAIRHRADSLGRAGKSSGNVNNYIRAYGLRDIANRLEDAAQGPTAAKTARARARSAYARWAMLNDASDPKAGGLFKPSDVQSEIIKRSNVADYYDRLRRDPFLQRLERMRHALERPEQRPGLLDRLVRAAIRYNLWHGFGPEGYFGGRVLVDPLFEKGRITRAVRGVGTAAGRQPGAAGAATAQSEQDIASQLRQLSDQGPTGGVAP